MNAFHFFIVICAFATCCEVYAHHRVRRLVGGQDAEPGQFPYIVSLRLVHSDRHFCAGSIIHQKFILTAAHCLGTISPNDFYIIAGTNLLNTKTERYDVKQLSIHSHHSRFKITNDIGLIKLKKGLKFSKFIQKIPLFNSEVSDGESATVCGWGRRNFSSFNYTYERSNDQLQYANVTTMPVKKCRLIYRKIGDGHIKLNKRNICTFDGPQVGFCNGDSGGPLVYKKKLVGIVSWSDHCALFPDVYVKVSAYTHWIEFTMKKLNMY